MSTGANDGTELEELAGFLRSHPALRAKNEIRLVSEVLGAGSWVHGPGDDGAVVAAPPGLPPVEGSPTRSSRAERLCSRPSSPQTPTAPGSQRSWPTSTTLPRWARFRWPSSTPSSAVPSSHARPCAA